MRHVKVRSTSCAATERRAWLRRAASLALAPVIARAAPPDVFARIADRPPAPDFALEDTERKPWRLSALRGQVVVVNFWATWCPPCRRELPSLEALHRAVADKGVVVLGIDAGEPWDAVNGYLIDLKPALTFPILTDERGEVMRAWQVKGLPTTFVIDRQGRFALRALGGRDFSRADAIADVTQLASER